MVIRSRQPTRRYGGRRPQALPSSDSATLADAVVREHRYFWARIVAYVVFAVVVNAIALLSWTLWMILPSPHGARFNDAISGSSALAAFGILATVVVALQVTVRAPLHSLGASLPSEIARQQAFEFVAALCGAGAVAVAIATLNTVGWASYGDIPRFWGTIAAGLLIAALAADAAFARDSGVAENVETARKRRLREQRITALVYVDSTTDGSPASAAMSAFTHLVGLPVLFGLGLTVPWGWSALLSGVLVGVLVFLVPLTLTVITRGLFMSGLVGAGWFVLAVLLATEAFLVVDAVEVLQHLGLSELGAVLVSVGIVAAGLGTSWIGADRLPGTNIRSFGLEAIGVCIRSQIRISTRHRRSFTKSTFWIPFVGIVAVHRQLALADQLDRRLWSHRLGYAWAATAICLLVIVVVGLLL